MPAKNSKSTQVTARIQNPLYDYIAELARINGVSVSALLNMALAEFISARLEKESK